MNRRHVYIELLEKENFKFKAGGAPLKRVKKTLYDRERRACQYNSIVAPKFYREVEPLMNKGSF